MSAAAIWMFLFGAILLWGGLALTITIAVKKSKKS
ncbi:MetS family NSS transporter small subunit [Cohnella luojiensis]|uniref:MetS family NSS transporter small subunit n=1 Tax=Cohnella luojiensis TaxID=652876 RepID=A0A4Y8LPL9_9BACL|nr:MetS family NSS transporter small subunit [Cohnella luojiensis]TFE22863.1 MetS family NSS transporter small subunit [Cohnella luojiensis]